MKDEANIIIFGGYVNGYSIARTINETYSLKPFIFDYKKQFSSKSKFVNYRMTYNPAETEKFIQDLKNFGKKTKDKKNIIFVTNDEWLIPLAKHKKDLEEYYIYTFSDWEVIKQLTIKKNLYQLCEQLEIPYPQTEVIDKQNINKIKKLKTPILIKPSNVVNYINSVKEKRNNVFDNYNDAEQFIIKCFKKYEDLLIAQEYIPGGVENLYTATTYSNKDGLLLGISIGHKLSQYPPEAGTITSGYTKYIEEIEHMTRKIIKESKYYGIANTEYKYDIRDNTYKLIEINPRPGMWNYSALKSGVNLFYLLIEDLYNQSDKKAVIKEEDIIRGKENVVWTVIPKLELKKILKNNKIYQYSEIIDPRKNVRESIKYKINLKISDIKHLAVKTLRSMKKERIS